MEGDICDFTKSVLFAFFTNLDDSSVYRFLDCLCYLFILDFLFTFIFR